MIGERVPEVHAALTATGGKVSEAAKLLDMPLMDLHNMIHSNKDLKARWATSKKEMTAPLEAETITRAVLKVDENQALAEAMDKEDALVRAGFGSMGLSETAVKLAMKCQQFQRKHFTKSIEAIGGGITAEFFKTMERIAKIDAELEAGAAERESMLRMDRAVLLEILGKTYDRANKAAMAQAIIKYKLQNDGNAGGPKKKPGFGAMIKANSVQVNVDQSTRGATARGDARPPDSNGDE